jgi:hypothetical protein
VRVPSGVRWWVKPLIGVVIAALVVLTAWKVMDHFRDQPEAARWRLENTAAVAPASTKIPVLVMESACASGQFATGRIVTSIAYSPDAVTIDIRVRPLGGAQTCQGVTTPYVVTLREPLGTRQLKDANAHRP